MLSAEIFFTSLSARAFHYIWQDLLVMHICLDTVGFKFIDGRKDATLLIEHDAHTGKCHQKTELQMHIVVC